MKKSFNRKYSSKKNNQPEYKGSYVGMEKPGPRTGRTTLKAGLSQVLDQMDTGNGDNSELKKAMRAQQVLTMFKQCMLEVFSDRQAAELMLKNINAVYIIKEQERGQMRKAPEDAPLVTKLVIYSCDSTVYAELDARQEQIKLWFIMHGEQLDTLQLMHSKLGMRRRRPFSNV